MEKNKAKNIALVIGGYAASVSAFVGMAEINRVNDLKPHFFDGISSLIENHMGNVPI